MKFKSTWVFAFLVIAMAAYVFWDFTEQKMKADLAEGESELTQFGSGEVKQFRLNSTQLDFSKGSCEITAPIQDLCDDMAVQSLLDKVGALKGKKVLSQKELEGREAEFGLDGSAVIAMSWTLADGKTGELKIGSANSFDGSFYIQMGDLYVTDREAGQLTNKGVAQLRNKKVWVAGEEIIRAKHPLFELVKSEKDWTFKPELPFGLDQESASEWIGNIQKIRATEVLDQKPEGLKSEMKLRFEVKNKEKKKEEIDSVELEIFGRDQNHFAVKVSSNDFYYLIPRPRLKTVLIQPRDLANGRAPFQFNLEQVTDVEIVRLGKKVEFKKKDATWDNPLLVDFFEKVGGLRARTFEPNSRFKINDQNQVSLKNSKGEVLLGFKWGAPYATVEAGINQGEPLRPVQVVAHPQWTFGVAPGALSALESLDFTNGTKKPPMEGEAHEHNHDH